MNSKITTEYNTLIAKPYAPNLGAEVYGIDLSKGITDEQYTEIRDAFLKYQVLFLKINLKYRQRSMLILANALAPYTTIQQPPR